MFHVKHQVRDACLRLFHAEHLNKGALRVLGRSRLGGGPRLNARDPPESVLSATRIWRILVEFDPIRVCEVLVGLGDVEVVGIDDEAGEALRIHIRCRAPRPDCDGCDGSLWSDGDREVELVNLPAIGRSVLLVWHKRRWRCSKSECSLGTVTEQDPAIAPPRERLTTRGVVGRRVRRVVAARSKRSLRSWDGCWHPVNTSVCRWGEALLEADTDRIGDTQALGLDEHLMWRHRQFRRKATGD